MHEGRAAGLSVDARIDGAAALERDDDDQRAVHGLVLVLGHDAGPSHHAERVLRRGAAIADIGRHRTQEPIQHAIARGLGTRRAEPIVFMTCVGVLYEAIYTAAAAGDTLPGIRLGIYKHGNVKYFTYQGENIIVHKCSKCGQDQSWGEGGNNYEKKLESGEYFCPNAPSLFVVPPPQPPDDDDESRTATSNHDANTSSTLVGSPCFW